MKSLFKILLLAVVAFASTAAHAQNHTKRINLEMFSGGSFNYGFQTTAVTTGGSAANADTIELSSNEAGVLRVTCIGYSKDSASAVTGVKVIRYNKSGGTLTLGTATNDLAVVTDTKLGSATFAVASVGNNAVVQITGAASITIYWKIKVERVFMPL